jgi:hypothetical protein
MAASGAAVLPHTGEELPFTDVTLRAEADGATARVHRGVLAAHSPVLLEALVGTGTDVIPLPGKSKAELDLLVAWIYRRKEGEFTQVRSRRNACAHTSTTCGLHGKKRADGH